ncbi:orotidine 5'-phosphate decarboxylase [Candidatus Babeliales bacterium]|nr:orotidine 5'-phosphate decarboxylase [Candidatus Babeliales bacterium]MCF7899239.1 orotidine 5'-phosphate decarboxylase [Candidatus Babeliales bacterium]
MKLQVSFDIADLQDALNIAQKIYQQADILEIGTILIYKYGISAIQSFKEKFPESTIFADAKIVDRPEEIVKIFAQAGADYVSVLAGTTNSIIKQAAQAAHDNGIKIVLDLVDAVSPGQSAMDAKTLDIDIIACHKPVALNRLEETLADWQYIRGNTDLPIFIAGNINKSNIAKILKLKSQGIVIGSAIVDAKDPEEEIKYFKSLIK